MEQEKPSQGGSGRGSWQPLSARLGGTPIDETWQKGIPAWVNNPVRKWLYHRLIRDETRDRLFARLHYHEFDDQFARSTVEMLSPDRLLDWLDGVLHITAEEEQWKSANDLGIFTDIGSDAKKLDVILREGHSIWKVSDAFDGLERRQDATVTAAAHQASNTASSHGRTAAAEHLQISWHETYGLHPDPSKAFGEAILAVEAVAVPSHHT
jgi:hypothetical protein